MFIAANEKAALLTGKEWIEAQQRLWRLFPAHMRRVHDVWDFDAHMRKLADKQYSFANAQRFTIPVRK